MDALTMVDRPSIETEKYSKSKWANAFSSFTFDTQVQEKYAEAIEALKEEARSMLLATGNTKSEKLVLIDTLERLGVAYHFEQEIEEQLEQIFKSSSSENNHEEEEAEGHDLFITSLQFRILRQHRHHASSGVFNKFKCQDNKFKETLKGDVKGLLSLYEAAHLRIHGEEILDEAVIFTVHHLKHMVQQLESPLHDHVKRALELPLHRGCSRIDTRHFISFYEDDDSKNVTLLKLAKLDFNYVQNTYKKDLCEISRWWDKMKSQLPYARSRVVEAYLWGTIFQFQPQYSYVRMAIAKSIQMLTIVDDTYDNYATVEEADIFTETLQRSWNTEDIDQLPDYMKIIYALILRVYDDYEGEAGEAGKQFPVNYAKETVKDVCVAYNKELKWFTGSVQMPSFEEYIANACISGCFYAICAGTIPGMSSVSKEIIDWLRSEPKIVKASVTICRYLDDMGSYERERKNGEVLTGVDFYMRQHGASLQETADKFIELTEDEWKDMNAEWMDIRFVPKDVLELVLGYARSSEVFYRSCEDGFTKPEVMAPHIAALFMDPIII